ncbi:MAG: glutamine synthetase adenylyltransferase, partial [Planctomycetes bacterium]|nr:glutamine synthetase adenylyltransferase [Planctomycetota bacterium]
IEHSLQLMHNKQTHELPQDKAELRYLARRLDFATAEHFLDHYQQHCVQIRRIYNRYLGPQDKAHLPHDGPPNPALKKHLSRLEREYSATFSEPDIEHHAQLAGRLDDDDPVLVEFEPVEDKWRVTIVGYDFPGELSLICGLLIVHGFDVTQGQVFTYEPLAATDAGAGMKPSRQTWRRPPGRRPARRKDAASELPALEDSRQKIVDVFTVRPEPGVVAWEAFKAYAADLLAFIRQLQAGETAAVQGSLVKRVAARLRTAASQLPTNLYPIHIEIDNAVSSQFTVLRIRAEDTTGFLYELTNALALSDVYISRVSVQSAGTQVFDTLFVTDARGQKIVEPQKLRELQTATVLIKHFTHLLPRSPNPEAALVHFREFVGQLFTRPDWPEELASLEQSNVLEALAQLLGVSDFLWNDFLRMQHGNLFPVVRDIDALATAKSREALEAELQVALRAAPTAAERRDALNAFKDREMFRVDMRHILGHSGVFRQFSEELSDLAEVVVVACTEMCWTELVAQYGEPRTKAGGPISYAVCALGKCGGRELGFASDIELMFVYEADGRTVGKQKISAVEFFAKLVEGVTHAIRAHREGIFEIDLRLRPYGKAGSLAVSCEAFQNYFGPEGTAWPYERQALVKLRPIAGNAEFRQKLSKLRDQMIYTGDRFDVAAMRGMRERQIRQLVSPGTFNAKLSPGGLVDAEYLVQGLQISFGHRGAELRSTNSLDAIAALARAEILSVADAAQLTDAYDFLRRLIGALRIVRGNARDLTLPPQESEEFAFLSRRLGYGDDLLRLRHELEVYVAHILDLSERLMN